MSDQADGLRRLVQSRTRPDPESPSRVEGPTLVPSPLVVAPEPADPPPRRCQSLVFTSGKGGVGTSNLALNMAISLGEIGRRVVLVDADLGLANIDLLCGLSPRHDLGDVLAGGCSLLEATVEGPGGIRIIAGFHAARALGVSLTARTAAHRLIPELARLEADADYLLVDAGSGLAPAITTLAASSDEVLVITTPEPTAVADAHATIGRLRRLPTTPTIRAVVNQVASGREGDDVLARLAASSRQFQGAVVDGLGSVRADPCVPLAVRGKRPFAVSYPSGLAARDVRRLALALIARSEPGPQPRKLGFFAVLAARWALARVAS